MNVQAHILIVEDTEENIDILMETLGDEFSISVALDGAMALKLVEKQKPDLILLDIQMPIMDGYEACRRLKDNPDTANIPVMFLTALTEDGDESMGLALGAVDYITKPYNPFLVKARVRNQIELKKHKDQLEELVRERTLRLQEAHEKLRLIDSTKNDFLGAISHELRTPANGVLGVAQLAIDYVPDETMKTELSKLFKLGNDRLLETIDNALLLARLQSSEEEMEEEDVNLVELLNDELEVVSPMADEKGLVVDCLSEHEIAVKGNPQLLSQVLLTLLRMTISMADRKSTVRVKRVSENGFQGLRLGAEGKQFNESLLETIFEPFSYERASSHISELGLAPPLAKKIVQVFNGDISLGNSGQSEFWVQLSLPSLQ